ncbi:cytochrome c biogenesis protein CcdA [Leucobacter exalbidus]|uniref:Cytochrome c biogenesis protein CcdA n=1 Tax=Leucobacter exalbidus TaxID=662960 RepID=A0A940PY87_9MICO|nr:cytochrome c biogenesis CcdA family protein [Leucobacter exalbidus]MBP1327564.1 cytochrome c biogenesis protein CcdA [Leucobacter exalbidus]
MNLTLAGAFLGGVLTLLSPCSVMLLPAFFAYAFTNTRALFVRTGVFFLGLASALVPLGLLAGTVGAWVSQYRFELVTVASWLVIALGVLLACGVRLPGVMRQRGPAGASALAVFALGAVYGLAGVCAGPLLGAALTFAAFGANAAFGGLVLLVFAAGMTLPLMVLALLWSRIPAIRKLVRPRELRIGAWRNAWTNVIGGVLTALIGVLLLVTRGTTTIGGLVGATAQAQLEGDVMRLTSMVPNWVIAVIFIVCAGAWAAVVVVRASPTSPQPACAAASSSALHGGATEAE